MTMIELRAATRIDLDWIVAQLRDFATFYGTKHSLFGDEDQARAGIGEMIDKHVFILAESHEKSEVDHGVEMITVDRAGFIAGYLSAHQYNPKVSVASEQFWWVAPEYRKGRAGLLLLNAFIKFGLENADIVTLSVIEGRSPINEDALTKRGFALHERAYIMET